MQRGARNAAETHSSKRKPPLGLIWRATSHPTNSQNALSCPPPPPSEKERLHLNISSLRQAEGLRAASQDDQALGAMAVESGDSKRNVLHEACSQILTKTQPKTRPKTHWTQELVLKEMPERMFCTRHTHKCIPKRAQNVLRTHGPKREFPKTQFCETRVLNAKREFWRH